MSSQPFRIYIGWDAREIIAYDVAKYSLERHSSVKIEVIPLILKDLTEQGLMTRPWDPVQSTEFTYTRFLVPHLAGYSGWAMFVDSDFLYTSDIKKLIDQIDDRYAIMCVQHDYQPKCTVKMDGKVQTSYPRKNWSSMILFNCGHPANKAVTPELVNKETGAYLHRFTWIQDDALIGNIDYTWNFLVGWYNKPEDGTIPAALHYTLGGPWFDEYKNCEFSDLWEAEKAAFESCVGK